MKSLVMAAAALGLIVSAAPAAMAANARTPYRNVDHSNDAGNNTGDSEVERLNNAQLDQNYTGPRYPVGQAPAPAAAPPMADDGPGKPMPGRRMHGPMHRPMHPPVHPPMHAPMHPPAPQ